MQQARGENQKINRNSTSADAKIKEAEQSLADKSMDKVLESLAATGGTKKKKCNSVCDVPVEKLADQLSSACSLGVLNDTDFRNMLDSAMVPRYKKSECEISGEVVRPTNGGPCLSSAACTILSQFRRAADASTERADREADEKNYGLTAFIQESDAPSRSLLLGGKRLTKSTSQDSKQKKAHSQQTTYGTIQDPNLDDSAKTVEQDSHTRAHSSGPKLVSKTSVEDKPGSRPRTPVMEKLECTSEIVAEETPKYKPSTPAMEKQERPECTIIDFSSMVGMEEGPISSVSNEDEKSIMYIDEDMPSSENSPSREPPQQIMPIVSQRSDNKVEYFQGNYVQELYAMNDLSNENDSITYKSSTIHSLPLRFIHNGPGLGKITAEDEKPVDCGENSFSCTSGQLRIIGNRQSCYDMSKTTSPNSDIQRLQPTGGVFSGQLNETTFKPINTQFANAHLQPNDTCRVTPAFAENDMLSTNRKEISQDKHSLARQKKHNKELRKLKNVIKPEASEGYMGNLDTEEILRKLGEEDKQASKPKKSQKATGISKESQKGPKSNGNKKSKEKRSQTGKDGKKTSEGKNSDASSSNSSLSPKHSVEINGGISPPSSDAGAGSEDSKDVTLVKLENSESGSEHDMKTDWKIQHAEVMGLFSDAPALCSAPAAIAGEEDEEEQYISADEGVNSNASDEVYHTDELSASSTHDLMNDPGNYLADSPEILVNKFPAEEPEFIPVTAKNKKKVLNGAGNDKKSANSSGVEKSSSLRQLPAHNGNAYQRRSSSQLTIDTTSAHANQQSPSPNEQKKFSGSIVRRQLNSLADYIEDNTVHKGQIRKGFYHGAQKPGSNMSHQAKNINAQEESGGKNQSGSGESLDRRSSQPSGAHGKYSAAVSHNSQWLHASDLSSNVTGTQNTSTNWSFHSGRQEQKRYTTVDITSRSGGRPPSPQSQLVSPAASSTSSSVQSLKIAKVFAKELSDDQNQLSPPPATLTEPTDMTNTACATATGANCTTSSSGTRSYADIAKNKSPTTASSYNSEMPQSSPRDGSPETYAPSTSTTNGERSASVTSSMTGSVGVIEQQESIGISTSVRQADGDTMQVSAIDGISFFFDPKEPTSICDQPPITPVDVATGCEFFSPSTPVAARPDEVDARSEKTKQGKADVKTEKTGAKIGKNGNKGPKGGKKTEKNEVRLALSDAETKAIKVDKDIAGRSDVGSKNVSAQPLLYNLKAGERLPQGTGAGVEIKLENGRTIFLPQAQASSSQPGRNDKQSVEALEVLWKEFIENEPAPVHYVPKVRHQGGAASSKSD